MLDIPALRQLCEAATKGPWAWLTDHAGDIDDGMAHAVGVYVDQDGNQVAGCVEFTDENRQVSMICFRDGDSWQSADANFRFIAAAREALPAALDEIEALRAELAAARAEPLQRAVLADCQPKSQDDAVYVSLKWRDRILTLANAPVVANMTKPTGA